MKALTYYDKSIEIDYEMGFKPYLPYHLYDKALCLSEMKNYKEAKIFNDKCFLAIKESNNDEYLFLHKVLKEDILYKETKDLKIKLQSIENLKALLEEQTLNERIAEVNYEISVKLNKLKIDSNTYKKKALKIYKKLFKKTPNIIFMEKIKELEKTPK